MAFSLGAVSTPSTAWLAALDGGSCSEPGAGCAGSGGALPPAAAWGGCQIGWSKALAEFDSIKAGKESRNDRRLTSRITLTSDSTYRSRVSGHRCDHGFMVVSDRGQVQSCPVGGHHSLTMLWCGMLITGVSGSFEGCSSWPDSMNSCFRVPWSLGYVLITDEFGIAIGKDWSVIPW